MNEEEYERMKAAAWTTYGLALAPALRRFQQKSDTAYTANRRVVDKAWKEYGKAKDEAWEALQRALDQADMARLRTMAGIDKTEEAP